MWTTSDIVNVIATAVLTVGVIASLVLGIMSLRKTEKIQQKQLKHTEGISKKEHESKLLDEIIEYAINCAKLSIKLNRGIVVSKKSREPDYLVDARVASSYLKDQMGGVEEYQTLRAKAEYMVGIVPESAEPLATHIENIKKSIIKQLNILHEIRVNWRGLPEVLNYTAETSSNNISIYEHAVKLSKDAANIKRSHWALEMD